MTKYRILEKKGRIEKYRLCNHNRHTIECEKEKYIPRFIVQEQEYYSNQYGVRSLDEEGRVFMSFVGFNWVDIKEFTSLEEAREYKRSLELKEGIVRE